ncbi:MAG: peptidyl-dipeptidase [Robiginitomaculum sp.]|nr:MAG: peptidyl-dipeptidase [Robiginitomaculum sp.]
MKKYLLLAAASSALMMTACQDTTTQVPTPQQHSQNTPTQDTQSTEPTIQEAKEFLEGAAIELDNISVRAAQIDWVNANFITEDTDALASMVGEEFGLMATRFANEAKRFNKLTLPADMTRKLDGIKRGSNFPAPDKPGAAAELAAIQTALNSAYGKGKFKYKGKEIDLGEASQIIASSRDPEELQAVWEGWRTIAPDMKNKYARMVEIINEGSVELGFKDTGVLWRAGYDMPADEFTKEADRLWTQVKPLYDELHCHVRAKLNENYGDAVVPLDQPIRADLLGNMWGQSWGNIYDLVEPVKNVKSIDETALLVNAKYDAIKMVKTGEAFFTSLGFEPLPETFWKRSLFVKPKDREVVCHASAWDIDNQDDIRIKMCIKIDGEDFKTVHHELGHNFYQRAYKQQPIFYKTGANDGFHEAIGDMIGLSITPEYLVKIGLLDPKDVPDSSADLNLLMQQALEKVAFLPFGLMVDKWRWNVFNGTYSPAEYNDGWWELREKYQGLKAPSSRPTNAFDPGAKYHIPGNTPYMRYFLAHILQFQFHKAACDIAGNTGPLHACSIYGNKEVGTRFNAMMQMGASRPWPEALEVFTGTTKMDGSAIIEYFDPLMTYLKEENKDRTCGW